MIDWTRGHGPTSSELAVPQLSSFLHSTTTGFGLFLVLVWPLTLPGIWPLQPWFKARYSSFFLSGFFTPYNHPSMDKRITFLLSFVISTESHWLWMVLLFYRLKMWSTQALLSWSCISLGPPTSSTLSADTPSLCEWFSHFSTPSLSYFMRLFLVFSYPYLFEQKLQKKKRKENRKCCSFFLPFLGLDRKIIKSNFSDPFQGRLN